MKSILYVSRSNLIGADAEKEVGCIVAGARDRNSEYRVTGMLVFTGEHFAQLLEGPDDAVDAIMASIRQDARHGSLREFTEPVLERSYADWSLGYKGQSTYVDRLVRSLFSTDAENVREAEAELRALMLLLAQEVADPTPTSA